MSASTISGAIAVVLSGRGGHFILLRLSVTRAKRKNILWGMSAAGCPTPFVTLPHRSPATPWPFVAMKLEEEFDYSTLL